MRKRFLIIISTMIIFLLFGCTAKENNELDGDGRGSYLVNPQLNEFNTEAVNHMIKRTPLYGDAFTDQTMTDAFDSIDDFNMLTIPNHYDVAVSDPDRRADNITKIMDIYFRSYMTEELQEAYDETSVYYSSIAELTDMKLLSEDKDGYVAYVSFKYFYSDTQTDEFNAQIAKWGYLADTPSGTYLYGSVCIDVDRLSDYVYELVGIAGSEETMAAYKEAYPDNAILYDTEIVEITARVADKQRASVNQGTLHDVQSGSCYVSESLIVLSFGGSYDVPVTVLVSTDAGDNYSKIVVDRELTDVRALFVSHPEGSNFVYLLVTSGRVMSEEGTCIYKSTDLGTTWEQIDAAQPNDGIHFLTTGFGYINDTTGFICIHSNDSPAMLYTQDGGAIWEKSVFNDIESVYTMTTMPFYDGEVLYIYVGESEYSIGTGPICVMSSTDQGATWNYEKKIYVD